VENLPEELEAKKKKELLSKRLAEKARRMRVIWSKRLWPLVKIWGVLQLKFRIYVGKVERLWHHEQTLKNKQKRKSTASTANARVAAESLAQQGEQWLQNKDYEQAEELFIEAIKLDVKCQPAYRGLGYTYLAKGQLAEAKETFQFLLQLNPHDDVAIVKLGEICENQGQLEEAIGYFQRAVLENDNLSTRFYHLAELLLKVKQPETAQEAVVQAVELEPKNPKYLDLLIEIAIICGNAALAEKSYQELRLVNPENKKLAEFKEKIEKI
jgi:tetratricopeptide (TPR) repeat protein